VTLDGRDGGSHRIETRYAKGAIRRVLGGFDTRPVDVVQVTAARVPGGDPGDRISRDADPPRGTVCR